MKKQVSTQVVIVAIVVILVVLIVIGYAVFMRKPPPAPVQENPSVPELSGTPMGMRQGMGDTSKANLPGMPGKGQ